MEVKIVQQKGNFILFETREEFGEWLLKQKVSRKISIIQNHHTWVPNYSHFNGKNHFERLEAMRNSHMKDRGFKDIAQHLTTFPDGTIAYSLGRNFEQTPAGIEGKNTGAICIEHLGDFDIGRDQMTEEHRKTIIYVNAILCKWLNLTPTTNTIIYHHWFASYKSCPGTNFFGGNKKEHAEKNFIPLIREELNKLMNSSYKEFTMYKERIYSYGGKLYHCEFDYSKKATDVRFMKFKTGKYTLRFVYESNEKVSNLVKKYNADLGTNAPFFFEGKILGDAKDGDKIISTAYGKMTKWHEFAFVNGKPIIGQLNANDKYTLLIQGAPLLVENGKPVYEHYRIQQEINDDIGKSRSQRTFAWIDKNGDLWFAWADGRTNYDQGLTLEEMALFAIEKGAITAINFDGGGSTIVADKTGGLNQKANTGANERVVHHALLFYFNQNGGEEKFSNTETPKIQREVTVIANGKKMSNGLLIDGVTYLPLRELGEFFGAKVKWDSATKKAYLNHIPVSNSYLINNLTYVPVRQLAEQLGAKVSWDQKTYTVTLTK